MAKKAPAPKTPSHRLHRHFERRRSELARRANQLSTDMRYLSRMIKGL